MRKVEDKVLEYLQTHKKSVTANQLAKYYIVSESSVKNALFELAAKEIIVVNNKVRPYQYRLK
jgi:predicted ArsR family transcriptional regulator